VDPDRRTRERRGLATHSEGVRMTAADYAGPYTDPEDAK
jgi:hypothetical protein